MSQLSTPHKNQACKAKSARPTGERPSSHFHQSLAHWWTSACWIWSPGLHLHNSGTERGDERAGFVIAMQLLKVMRHVRLLPAFPSLTFIFTTMLLYSSLIVFFLPAYFYMTVIYNPEFKDLLQCTRSMANSKWCVQPGYYSLKSHFFHSETSGLCIMLRLLSSNSLGLFRWE